MKKKERKTMASFKEKLTNPADHTSELDPQDISDNKVMAVLAYIWILFLVPLLAAKDSKYARFHTNQGIILFIAEVILGVISFIPIIGWIISSIGGICTFILFIIGIINAVKGQAKDLPVIGDIRILK